MGGRAYEIGEFMSSEIAPSNTPRAMETPTAYGSAC